MFNTGAGIKIRNYKEARKDAIVQVMLPIIETKRLILRPPKMGDEILLNQCIHRSLSELKRWMPWAKDPSMESTLKFVKDGMCSWQSEGQRDFPIVIIDKLSQEPIGASGFNNRSKPEVSVFEIGYWLDERYKGQGLATEAVLALTEFAFNSFHAIRVQIVTQVGNEASRRVAEKSGFILEAVLKNFCLDCVSGEPADDWMFARFKI